VSLVFILGGSYAAGWMVYGTLCTPYLLGGLPLPAAFYGVLVFPIIWGLTEQMTYMVTCFLASRFFVGVRAWRSLLSRSHGRSNMFLYAANL
jgi:hypothetical protein